MINRRWHAQILWIRPYGISNNLNICHLRYNMKIYMYIFAYTIYSIAVYTRTNMYVPVRMLYNVGYLPMLLCIP